MQTTILLKLTLEGSEGMTERDIQQNWLEKVPVFLGSARRRMKIVGAAIVAGLVDSEEQLCQLPVSKINMDGWRLHNHGQIGTPEVPRLMNHIVVYADPYGDEKLPFVTMQCDPDNLDGTQSKVTEIRRFRRAAEVGSYVQGLISSECSDGKSDHITAAQFLAELRRRQPQLLNEIATNKNDLFQTLCTVYRNFTGRLERVFLRHLSTTLFTDKGYEEDFTLQADEFWRLLEASMQSWFDMV